MPFKMFSVAKVGLTCDSVVHSTEKRKDGEQKVIVLTLRVQPFDRKLAVALNEEVMRTLFKSTTPDPQPHIARVNFLLGIPRQHLDCYATSDTKDPSRRLEFAKISGVYARTESGMQGYALVFKATFGPVSDKELGFVEAWRNGMKFVSFVEAEPNADFDEVDHDDADEDDDAQQALPDPEADEVDPAASKAREQANKRARGRATH